MKIQMTRNITIVFLAGAIALSGCASSNTAAVPRTSKYDMPERRLLTNEGKVSDETMDTAESYEHLGDLNLQKGDITTAFVNYSKALRMEPGRSSVSYKTGRLFLLRGMTEEARGEFEKIIKKEPESAGAHEGMGRAWLLDGNSDKAIEYFTKALGLNERLWETHNLLGIAYDRQRKFSLAIEQYRTAISIKPDAGALYNNLGVSHYMNGEYDKAKDAFATALKKGEERGRVYNNLALTYAKMGDYRAAHETFKREGSEASAQNNIGYLYLRDGKNSEAVLAFEKAIELSPAFYREAHDNLKTARGVLQE